MRQADRFLFSLVVNAGRRGRRFVLKQEHAKELADKWLCLMADVDEKKLRYGLTSKEESRRLREAAKFLNELPLYLADDDDEDSEPRYLPEPSF